MPSTVSHCAATRNCRVLLLIFILSLLHPITPSTARDTITPNHPLTDQDTLVSPGEVFELGFFTGSAGRYIGIWYHNIPDQIVVWVANREAPITNSAGVLTLTANGNLTLLDINGSSLWSTSTTNIGNPIVQLLDNGNLVLTQGGYNGSQSIVWQSFDYPTNAMLPGTKLGFDVRTNISRRFTSWKTASDPSPGLYAEGIVGGEIPEIYMWNGSSIMSRIGWWDGQTFIGVAPVSSPNYLFFQFQSSQDETFYSYETMNSSIMTVVILDYLGTVKRMTWLNNEWHTFKQYPTDKCDMYAECSTYGLCETEGSLLTSCNCLRGFEPRRKEQWALRDWSGGCMRTTALNCSSDGFVLMSGLKLPDITNSSLLWGMGLDECKDWCLNHCSCEAIAVISGEVNGCLAWFGNLIDIREMAGGGHDLYLRLAASELDRLRENSSKKNLIIGTTISAILGIALLILVKVLLQRKKRRQGIINDCNISGIRGREMELQLFDLRSILIATNYFSFQNKLGEGGFGQVYQGQMEDGQEIAVKKLSKDSVQGLDEFKNEAILIAKLQHRNLVRLLGCCIQGDERMLVYEYMQNKSLDYFIFDDTKHELLDWRKRLDIILGIARGLLYLHQDSRFKIIHRDLKASNILLDKEMNPKISDFGIARIFKGDQMQENTDTVMGTIGYMAPEYAMDGIFSVKSDVFSFGVLVLEILSGKKNKVVYEAEPNMNLLAHAWRLWKEGECLELLDKSLQCSCPVLETMRCIQVALLCVQERSDDRPTMASVVMMLGSEGVAISPPTRPGFCIRKNTMEIDISSTVQHSTSEVTVTLLHGR